MKEVDDYHFQMTFRPHCRSNPSRIGGLAAVKATAHKLACLVYRMLKYGQEYVTQSMEEYEAKVKANMLKALKRKAAAMGLQLSPLPTQ
jgi:transposase